MILLDNLSLRAGAFALDGLSLSVAAGEYAVLMGKTGCGKTSLLEAICGLRPVTAGRIVLVGRDVTRLRPAERGVGYVPQDLALFPTLTVRDHLAFALVVRRWRGAEIECRVAELAGLLGIGHLLARYPAGLSGGEAQRVALGRALAFQPRILLLDEPLAALDEDTRSDMVGLLRCVRRLTGVTTLHVTHSLTEARRLADRLFILDGAGLHAALEQGGGRGDPGGPMTVIVRYLAQLRRLAGRSIERLDLAGPCTLAGLVAALAERHPELSAVLVDDQGQGRPSVLVFVGDEQASPDRPLSDGDEVTLLAPIAGGE